MKRREFIRNSSLAAAAAIAFPQVVKAETVGLNGRVPPSGKLNLGVIACGNRALSGAQGYTQDERVRFAAFCDPYDVNIIKYKHRMTQEMGVDCSGPAYVDFRELLQDPDIDAVHIATPDHWHVPIALAAARAGKDIYCEKPLGLSVEQCLAARSIAAKHGRVFQYGTQNRSVAQVRLGIQLALNGGIGKVNTINVWAPPGEEGFSATPELVPPKSLNYELWQGPAPMRPFCHDRFFVGGQYKGIYHISDYAIGFIAGWGAHPLDQLQWYADHAGLGIPVRYEGSGRIPQEGLFDTVTHWDMALTYANGMKIRFTDTDTWKASKDPNHPGAGHGTMFVGEDGWVNVHRGGWAFSSEDVRQRVREAGRIILRESRDHCRDFVDAVFAGEPPVSDLGAAIRSDLISHLCNIAIRVGRPVEWDPKREKIAGDKEAAKMMRCEMREPYGMGIEV